MSGDVVGKLSGNALEAAQAASRSADAYDLQIRKLAEASAVESERMWRIVEEVVRLDRSRRSYRFNPTTGEVVDAGPEPEEGFGL